MVGAVHRRARERVHARVATDAAHAVLLDDLRGAQQQHAALGDQEAAGFDGERKARIRGADFFEARAPRGEVEIFRIRRVGDRQAAADVDGLDGAHAVGQAREFGVHAAPVLRIVDAAAQVRVQRADAHVERARERDEFIEALQGQTELRRDAPVSPSRGGLRRGPGPGAATRAVAEDVGPALQRFDVVDGHGDAARERGLVFVARREARGEQHALR